MVVQFNIGYKTAYGENLFIRISEFDNEGKQIAKTVVKMRTDDGDVWKADATFDNEGIAYIDYSYVVYEKGEEERCEWAEIPHRLEFSCRKALLYITTDIWTDISPSSFFYSSAFTDCVFPRKLALSEPTNYRSTMVMKTRAPQLRKGQRLAICGSDKALGEWDTKKAIPMVEHNYNEWVASIDLSTLDMSAFNFKFVVLDDNDPGKVIWEEGFNRFGIATVAPATVDVNEYSEVEIYQKRWKAAGTVIPVFSLRSKGGFGVGDFGDLCKMIDWVAKTRQRVLQILPVNDTSITHTWTDSYPYNSISIYALHPMYADLRALPQLDDAAKRKTYAALQKELNALPQIDYERVNNAKLDYLKDLFAQEGKHTLATKAFKTFFESNKEWLVPYAAFCYYRDKYGTSKFSQWPEHRTFDDKQREHLSTTSDKSFKLVAFYYFVQYILDKQMTEAHAHARDKGIILKGDIPIGISPDSVEAWIEPYYFNLNGQAGAPPDPFSANGQNWGFPTYNWDTMLKDHCKWWVNRFTKMAQYFDAYRIDHILGFFRIWEIPINAVHGLLGQFSPSLGLTPDEIEYFGLSFREELFTQPFITDWIVDKIFGKWADEVRKTYLDCTHDDMYKMKSAYDTQRKVEAAFAGKTTDDDKCIRDGLYSLISEVLFVRDHKKAGYFHPRIAVQLDYVFEMLNDNEKAAFNRLYDDYYYERNNQFWYDQAMKKLPTLTQSTRMLACAEDLGMVPACVPWLMNDLRILSLEIQSMPKNSSIRFSLLSSNPYRSVCTISTHDMPTLRGWWREDRQRTQAYYNTVLCRSGEAPKELSGELARDIVMQHLMCPSMLCILSLQDWLSIDEKIRLDDPDKERINIPANPRHYWRYRMHLNIEDLMKNDEFNGMVTSLIDQASIL